MYSFFQSCTNSVVLIYIFLKSCATTEKLYNQRKTLYIFGTLSLALNFIPNGVLPMYSFHQSLQTMVYIVHQNVQFFPKLYKFCGPYIYIFKIAVQPLKSCTTKEKKLYIFGTLSLALNFLHNGVCTKMYSFLQSCTNSVVLIYIFLKSCTTT